MDAVKFVEERRRMYALGRITLKASMTLARKQKMLLQKLSSGLPHIRVRQGRAYF